MPWLAQKVKTHDYEHYCDTGSFVQKLFDMNSYHTKYVQHKVFVIYDTVAATVLSCDSMFALCLLQTLQEALELKSKLERVNEQLQTKFQSELENMRHLIDE